MNKNEFYKNKEKENYNYLEIVVTPNEYIKYFLNQKDKSITDSEKNEIKELITNNEEFIINNITGLIIFLDNKENYKLGSLINIIPSNSYLYFRSNIHFIDYRLRQLKIMHYEKIISKIDKEVLKIKANCKKYKGTNEYEFYIVSEVLNHLAKRYIYDKSANDALNIIPIEKMPNEYYHYKEFKLTLVVYYMLNGVCNSFSSLIDYFLKELGIKTIYVSSKTHAWNKVKLNRKMV